MRFVKGGVKVFHGRAGKRCNDTRCHTDLSGNRVTLAGARRIRGTNVSIKTKVLARHRSPGGSSEHPQAFESKSHPGRALTVLESGALSDLDNITVRIADVAANFAIFGDRFRDELGSSIFP